MSEIVEYLCATHVFEAIPYSSDPLYQYYSYTGHTVSCRALRVNVSCSSGVIYHDILVFSRTNFMLLALILE